MNFISIDWFYGLCYFPEIMNMFRKANPTVTDEHLGEIYSVLPKLSEEEVSNYDPTQPAHRIIDVTLGNTSSYFDMGSDYLERPHELSVACFDKDVLSRYDIEIKGSYVHCSGWKLQDLYLNGTGQVHVCLCDLAELPEEELKYWNKHNVRHDIEGSQLTPVFHGMSKDFVNRCLFNIWK